MDQGIVAALEELQGLNVAALRNRYRQVVGEESKSSNKQFLVRRIAWRLQANLKGGLSERARRRAEEIADDADLRTRAPRQFRGPDAPGKSGVLIDYARSIVPRQLTSAQRHQYFLDESPAQ